MAKKKASPKKDGKKKQSAPAPKPGKKATAQGLPVRKVKQSDEKHEVGQRVIQLCKVHSNKLLEDLNITGFGFGQKHSKGENTGRFCLTVMVARKIPLAYLPVSRLVPDSFRHMGMDIETDIIETGPLYPHEGYRSLVRPAKGGDSIGETSVTAGTLGCLVRDNTDGTTCILSNNHVLADENNAPVGAAIVQPGPLDGGVSPLDRIATLKRFIPLMRSGNTVDCAIAQPVSDSMVVNAMEADLLPPGPDHKVVGLLFAGSCSQSIINPIESVLSQLNISFLADDAVIEAEIGMNVEKVGRTTGYTTSEIRTLNTTVRITYGFGSATFNNQITTGWLSNSGDSGSIVFNGGKGGLTSNC